MTRSVPQLAVFGGSTLIPLGVLMYAVGVEGYLPGNVIILGGLAVTVGIGSFVLLERRSAAAHRR
ncbi:hypothetical protein GRS48_00240 [Halorubrum sp. JWXQ-INN 858]|uniref:hypothetical protein n=1 Tax=Halorubrum sp. JWXQ-INN 858 TaxID=2690782 RepID=UPI00135AF524|nr:hypothetical protein [Halorubrum sp. JWXQ-INN 858]MWV63264.1 hypothetical protein [Halorubrum sp. JWXQ-INN 858]